MFRRGRLNKPSGNQRDGRAPDLRALGNDSPKSGSREKRDDNPTQKNPNKTESNPAAESGNSSADSFRAQLRSFGNTPGGESEAPRHPANSSLGTVRLYFWNIWVDVRFVFHPHISPSFASPMSTCLWGLRREKNLARSALPSPNAHEPPYTTPAYVQTRTNGGPYAAARAQRGPRSLRAEKNSLEISVNSPFPLLHIPVVCCPLTCQRRP